MIQKVDSKNHFLSHFLNLNDHTIYECPNGVIGTGIELKSFDHELESTVESFQKIIRTAKALPEDIKARLILKSRINSNYTQYKTNFIIEKDKKSKLFNFNGNDYSEYESLSRTLKSLSLYENHARILKSKDYKELTLNPKLTYEKKADIIDNGLEKIAVIRLYKQTNLSIHENTLKSILQNLPKPFEIHVSFKRASDINTLTRLKIRKNQLEAIQSAEALHLLKSNEEASIDTNLLNAKLFNIEWLLVLKRETSKALTNDLKMASELISRLGEYCVEGVGLTRSYFATLLGEKEHYVFLEKDENLPFLLPLFRDGDANEQVQSTIDLSLKRLDDSKTTFDLFAKFRSSFNVVINGKPGSGKSVFGNLLTSVLLKDTKINIIKVDVGGSYKKECEENGGLEVSFTLDERLGIDPVYFAYPLKDELQNEVTTILSSFISSLILEVEESELSKDLFSKIEEEILKYLKLNSNAPSFDDLLSKTNLPRLSLLKRWGKNGVFKNIMENPKDYDSHYLYFNFENIQTAANPDFAQGCMSLVTSFYNLKILSEKKSSKNRRFVFFVDETPFFIQRNARFFKLTAANARKFGHSLLLIAQSTTDLLIESVGGVDDTILKNSPTRFFFQVDGNPHDFKNRFNLDDEIIEKIQNLNRSSEYREVLLSDELGHRILRIELTKEEYWRFTSSKSDNEKLEALMRSVPHLTKQEAIRCLSI